MTLVKSLYFDVAMSRSTMAAILTASLRMAVPQVRNALGGKMTSLRDYIAVRGQQILFILTASLRQIDDVITNILTQSMHAYI